MNRKILISLAALAALAFSTAPLAHQVHGGHGHEYAYHGYSGHHARRHYNDGRLHGHHGHPYRYGTRVYVTPYAAHGHRHYYGCGHAGYYPRYRGIGFGFTIDGISFAYRGH